MVVQACNSSYLGDRDWEDRGSWPAQAVFTRPPSQSMAEAVVGTFNPSDTGKHK
jgi:hypothetical protein